jgi:hypothetical protein
LSIKDAFGTQDVSHSSHLHLGIVKLLPDGLELFLKIGYLRPHVVAKALEVAKLGYFSHGRDKSGGRKEARDGNESQRATNGDDHPPTHAEGAGATIGAHNHDRENSRPGILHYWTGRKPLS